jgi:DNA-binding CsgD family transcriptional regulator
MLIESLSPAHHKVFNLLMESPQTSRDVANQLGISIQYASGLCRELTKLDLAVADEMADRDGRYWKWRLI